MYLDVGARALLAVVFLAATVSKWRDYGSFRRSVVEFGVPWPGLTAAFVLAAEPSVVVLVTVPTTVLAGYTTAVLLLGAFMIGITSVLRRRRAVTCRCFGAKGGQLRRHHIVRNALLAAAALTGGGANVLASNTAVSTYGAVIAGVTGAAIAVLIISWDDIVFALAARQHQSLRSAHPPKTSASSSVRSVK